MSISLKDILAKVRPEIAPLVRSFKGEFVYSPTLLTLAPSQPDVISFDQSRNSLLIPGYYSKEFAQGDRDSQQLSLDLSLALVELEFARLFASTPIWPEETRNPKPWSHCSIEFGSHYFVLVYLVSSFKSSFRPSVIGRLALEQYHPLLSLFSAKRFELSTCLRLGEEILKSEPSLENEIMEQIISLVQSFLPLFLPTHVLLALGGDERLRVSPETLSNRYFNMFYGIDSTHVLQRGSCTASSPTLHSYDLAEKLRWVWLTAYLSRKTTLTTPIRNPYVNLSTLIRSQLEDLLGLEESDVRMMLTPSGTDAELLVTLIALARHPKYCKELLDLPTSEPLVANILCAAGEVGSGTQNASSLQYFSSDLPLPSSDPNPKLSYPISGAPLGIIETILINARTNEGQSSEEKLARHEFEIEEKLKIAIVDQKRIGLLHLVHFSKTGILFPSISFLQRMKQRFGNSLVAVVDACQMRCDDFAIRAFVNQGSKFLGGVPFCGAVMARSEELQSLSDPRDRNLSSFGPASPARMTGFKYEKYSKSSEVPILPIPRGLSSFFSGFDVDPRLTALAEALPPNYNFGLLLRWRTAINEFQRLRKYPSTLRQSLVNEWTSGCEDLIRKSSYLRVLPRFNTSKTEYLTHSVISFFLSHPTGEPFTRDELKEVHELLTIDLRPKLGSIPEAEKPIAARKVLTGQPVLIDSKGGGVLRLALSAPIVAEMAEEKSIKSALNEDLRIIEKLELISKYFHILSPKDKPPG